MLKAFQDPEHRDHCSKSLSFHNSEHKFQITVRKGSSVLR